MLGFHLYCFLLDVDEIITMLIKSDIDCHLGLSYAGSLGYADNFTLINPTLQSVNKKLDVCIKFATEYYIRLYPKKTVCIKFGSPFTNDDRLLLDGCLIQWVDQVTKTGYIVAIYLNDSNDFDLKKCIFNGYVNKLCGNYCELPSEA